MFPECGQAFKEAGGVLESGLAAPDVPQGVFLLYFVLTRTVMPAGGRIFTMLMSVSCIWGNSLGQVLLHVGTIQFHLVCSLHSHSPHLGEQLTPSG